MLNSMKLKFDISIIAVFIIGCVVAFTMGEILVRTLHLSKTINSYRLDDGTGKNPFWNLNSVEGNSYNKNLHLGFDNPYHPEFKSNYSITIAGTLFFTNQFGYRGGYAYQKIPDPSKLRIILIGDSVAFGYRIAFEKLFSTILADKLLKIRSTEILNFGMGGTDTKGNIYNLLRAVEEFHPDIILYQFGLNDITKPFISQQASKNKESKASKDKKSILIKTKEELKHLLRQSALYLFFAERYNYVRLKKGERTKSFESWTFKAQTINRELQEFEKIFNLLKKKIPILFMFFPYDWQVYSNDKETKYIPDILNKFCGEKNVPYIDLTPHFKQYSNQYDIFLDDAHLSEVGHQITSEILFSKLKKMFINL